MTTKILGLDIGVASIGWWLNEITTDECAVLGSGVRIVPLKKDEADNFSKAKTITTTKDRTVARTARKMQHRYKLRKQKLRKIFEKLEIMPTEKEILLSALELYGLRNKAIAEQISLQEIGRIFFHLNQKRGYKSSRKAKPEDEKAKEDKTETAPKKNSRKAKNIDNTNDITEIGNQEITKNGKPKEKGYLELIADREQILKDRNLTVGQYFYELLQENELERLKDRIFLRETYHKEFDKIWETQAKFYPQILTKENYKLICDEIIYFQRPLKSQKHLVGKCIFEKSYKTTPRSSPLFQEFVVWQMVNNVEVTQKYGKKNGKKIVMDYSLNDKKHLFDYLQRFEKITDKECLELLGYNAKDYQLNYKEIKGNTTLVALAKALNIVYDKTEFAKHKIDLFVTENKNESENLQSKRPENELLQRMNEAKIGLYDLWHLLYAEENDEAIKRKLRKWNFAESEIEKLLLIDFTKQGFGNLSTKAVKKLLPELEKGFKYDKACKNVGYNHSNSLTTEENDARKLEDKLEILDKNSLRNPLVEKVVNQVIHLINEIIETYGKPDEIVIELARELKQNAKQRANTLDNNKTREKERKKNEEEIKILFPKLKKVPNKLLLRYELAKQQNWISPYTNLPIEPSAILYENGLYDIDHILPQSRFFDDSPVNLVLVESAENKGKNNQTAYDYMQSKSKVLFDKFVEHIKATKYPKNKAERLQMTEKEIPEDFINRQLQDTRYIVKELKGILGKVCRTVRSTSGGVTDYLRHEWGISTLLRDMREETYPDTKAKRELAEQDGTVEKPKTRDDHRHHIIDAAVIALTSQAHIQRLNNLNQEFAHYQEMKEKARKMPCPVQNLHEIVKDELENTLVSYKGEGKVVVSKINKETGQKTLTPRGRFHEETIYGSMKRYATVKFDKRFLQNFLAQEYNETYNLVDKELQEFLIEQLANYNNDLELFMKNQKKNPLKFANKIVEKVSVFETVITVKYKLSDTFAAKDVQYIVDSEVREKVRLRLTEYGNDSKKAFANLKDEPIYLKNGMTVKTVKCDAKLASAIPLHYNENNEPISYVKEGNNHHIAIYKDKNGKLYETVCTFWDAVNRKLYGLPVVIKEPQKARELVENANAKNSFKGGSRIAIDELPETDWEFVTSLQKGEMFVFRMTKEEIETAITQKKYKLISKNLYRVQKISEANYMFRHHLEAVITNEKAEISVRSLGNMTGIKVKINCLGRIVKVGE